ncbi:N-acetyltransferase, partial [bacterium]|nr:N-acetyltransferase [bacterium]
MSLKRRIATSATISILLEGNIDDHAAAGELVMRQWGARFPLWTLANWKTQVFAGIGTQMPVSVVAKSENRVVGVVSLKNFGMDPEDPEGQLYSHLQPWVSYLVVSPTFRGGGCGSAL